MSHSVIIKQNSNLKLAMFRMRRDITYDVTPQALKEIVAAVPVLWLVT